MTIITLRERANCSASWPKCISRNDDSWSRFRGSGTQEVLPDPGSNQDRIGKINGSSHLDRVYLHNHTETY